jgi:hypothetical protein
MKASKISKLISIVYSSIVSVFLFICVASFALFIILQNGLYLEKLTISNLSLQNTAIKWDEKLNISVDTLKITPQTNSSSTIPLEKISHYVDKALPFLEYFGDISLKHIVYGTQEASLVFTKEHGGVFHFHNSEFTLTSNISARNHIIHLHLQEAKDLQRKISLFGDIYLNTRKVHIDTKLFVDINNDANLTFYGHSNLQTLHYAVKANKPIKDITHIINLTHLPQAIRYWAYDAIDMKNVTLTKLYGTLDFANLQEGYKQLYIEADVHKLNYTYHKDLDAIHTKKTTLIFKDGIFYIYPKKAFSYGINLKNSWLKIDFTLPHELLTLNLFLDAKLNKDILKILKTYKINLPFLQKKGVVNAKLQLLVDLRTIDVKAYGDFKTKKANFDYLGVNLDVTNTHVRLKNYDVSIDKMKVFYKNIAQAVVDVRYNAHDAKGTININLQKVHLNKLQLKTQSIPILYTISPKSEDSLKVGKKSQWVYDNNTTLTLDPLKAHLNMKNYKLSFDTSYFQVKQPDMSGFVTGDVYLKEQSYNFNIDLLHLNAYGIKLKQSNTQLHLHYKDKLSIQSLQDIYFTHYNTSYKLSKFYLDIKQDHLRVTRTHLMLNKYLATDLYGDFNLAQHKAKVTLENFLLINPQTRNTIFQTKKITLALHKEKKKILIDAKEFNTTATIQNNRWDVAIQNIKEMAKYSPLLQRFEIDDALVKISKKNTQKNIYFDAKVHYPYPIIENTTNYKVHGKIKPNGDFYLRVNDTLKVNYKKTKWEIALQDKTIDIDALLKVLEKTTQKKQKQQEKQTPLVLFLKAKNTQLKISENRYVLSDTITLQYYNQNLTAQLKYKKGVAGLQYKEGKFYLYGQDFNDKFMDKLLYLSKFSGGTMDFSMYGSLENYQAVFFLNDTIITDYKILNNILAFINTVPSLMTFSIPGYNTKGLKVKQAYMNFTSNKGELDISDIYLGSKELTIVGKGKANIKKNTIDVKLNLKTDLGSNISKIPLVGYILLDGDTISTTLKIEGALDNPTVKSLLAEDIMVAPLNIIERTLTLPYKLIKGIGKSFETDKK